MLITLLAILNSVININRCCLDKQASCFSRNLSALDWENLRKFPYQVVGLNMRTIYPRLVHSAVVSARKHRMCRLLWRAYSMPVSVEESSSLQSEDHAGSEEDDSEDSPEKILSQPLSSAEVNLQAVDALFSVMYEVNVFVSGD